MLPESCDVVVVGRRQCRHLRRFGRARAPRVRGPGARACAGGGVRRQHPVHRGRDPLRLQRGRGPARADARSHRGRDRAHRLRRLYRGPVLRRHGAGDREPRRPRSRRAAGSAQQSDPAVAAQQGDALRADLRPAGVQGRRPLQVLGRADGGSLGRRPRHRRSAEERGCKARHPDRLRGARDVPAARRRRCAWRHRALSGKDARDPLPGSGPRSGRLRGQSRVAHPLSRPGLGPRQSARHALQHR